jgi:Ni/Co efflux regulator RcnB
MRLALTVAIAMLAPSPALADKPSWAGGNHDDHPGKGKGKGHRDRDDRDHRRFEDRNRVVVRDYYVTEYRSGHCPPGLAKKHNGCMPPGQAKKWRVGRPLPREVVYYDLPPTLVVQIGPPPSGYRYVRVAADILMIAVGTGLVVDAIQDLGR